MTDEKWSWCKCARAWQRPERWVMIADIFIMFRDNLDEEFGKEHAWCIALAELGVLVVCIFAEAIRKRLELSTIAISRGDTKMEIKNDG